MRLDECQLIVVVVDGEAAGESRPDRGETVAVAAQQADAERMKRGYVRRARGARLAEQILDTLAHLLGGFVGERHRQNRVGRNTMFVDQVRDAMRDDARFAAAGAGEDQQRTFDVGRSFTLLGIQALQEIHERGGRCDFIMGTRVSPEPYRLYVTRKSL